MRLNKTTNYTVNFTKEEAMKELRMLPEVAKVEPYICYDKAEGIKITTKPFNSTKLKGWQACPLGIFEIIIYRYGGSLNYSMRCKTSSMWHPHTSCLGDAEFNEPAHSFDWYGCARVILELLDDWDDDNGDYSEEEVIEGVLLSQEGYLDYLEGKGKKATGRRKLKQLRKQYYEEFCIDDPDEDY